MAQGTKWYNNGEKNIQVKEGDPVPEGFVPGMKCHPYTEVRRKEILNKRKKTNLERYGVANPFQSEEVKDKIKQTNIERYGTENAMQSEEIKGRLRQSNLEIFGVEYSWQSEDVKEKIKQTNIERYGTEWAAQSDIVKEKIKETNIERYGGYTLQSEELRDKVRETNIKRYGVANPFQSEEVKDKIKQTNIERYGVDNPSKAQEIKDKTEKSNMEKYGVKSTMQLEEVQRKSMETLKKNYGVYYPMQSSIIQKRTKQTNLERYGVENPMQSDSVKETLKKSVQERYGVDYVLQSEGIREKIRETLYEHYKVNTPFESDVIRRKSKKTLMENYGVNTPLESEGIREKIKQTNLERYGVENPFQSEEVRDKIKSTNTKKYGYPIAIRSIEVKEKVIQTCQEKYGVDWPCEIDYVRKSSNGYNSGPNKDFERVLETNEITYQREFSLKGYSYDFKVNNILIEINPYATHNTIWSPFGNHVSTLRADYHQKKSHIAEEHGYQVIHIFDWDDKEKIIKNLLSPKEKVFARKTKVFGIERFEVRSFLNEYHLQGTCNGQSICLGLRDEFGELISIMTFGKPRYNKNYQWELLRYCSSKSVIGGAEKLFKYFINTYNPESIISYCDRSKFRGDVYNKLGFILALEGKPSKHWFGMRDGRHITDNLLRQRGFDQLFNTNYGKGTSNEELIIKAEYVPIYDCGQDTYTWSNK